MTMFDRADAPIHRPRTPEPGVGEAHAWHS